MSGEAPLSSAPASTGAGLLQNKHLTRGVILSACLAAVGYLGFSLWAGSGEVLHGLHMVGIVGVLAALALSLVNYGLRFVRWQMYLAAFGNRVPTVPSAIIYLAGFAFTTTPGKVGELLRGVFLANRGIPLRHTGAAFVSERLSDLLAVAIICLPGLALLHEGGAIIAIGFAFVAALGAVLIFGQQFHALYQQLATRFTVLDMPILRNVALMLSDAARCHRRNVLIGASLLSLIAWSAEAYAFHIVLDRLGIEVGLWFAMAVYALAMLAGALSFLPGGLGGTEVVMIAALTLRGAPGPEAVAATIIIRLATLWFAVVIGLIAVLLGRRALYPPQASDPLCEPG